MGKAATNERKKLTATYLNSIAVGIAIAGLVVPYFGHLQGERSLSDLTPLEIALYGAAVATAFVLSWATHMAARSWVADLED
jgi:hypothetical protein